MNKSLTRLLSVLLVLVMFVSVGTPAFAEGTITRAGGGSDEGDDWDRDIGQDEIREFVGGDAVTDEPDPMLELFAEDQESGLAVTVEAPQGSLPTLAELRIERVDVEDVREAVEEAMDGEQNILMAVDISFWLNGIEIEPEDPVQVIIAAPELEGEEDLTLVHVPEEEEPETVDLIPQENLTFTLGTNEIAFQSAAFSVYAVVGNDHGGEDARLFVKFKQSDNSEITIPVKLSDINTQMIDGVEVNHFEEVLYDPGVGAVEEGKMFLGWTTESAYDENTPTLTIAKVREAVQAKLQAGITDGEVLTYYPVILNARYVSYLDELGASIKNDLVLFKDNVTKVYTVNHPYIPREQDCRFDGWAVATYNTTTGQYDLSSTLYQNQDTISFTKTSESIVLMAKVPRGHWINFHENGEGASYTAPLFILSEGKPVKPDDPDRTGYSFVDWYAQLLDADGNPRTDDEGNPIISDTPYDGWGKVMTYTQNLYAKWSKDSSAYYTVIIWKQQVTGNKYDFSQSIRISGSTSGTINPVTARNTQNSDVRDDYAQINNVNYTGVVTAGGKQYDYNGFHLGSYDQNIAVAPEGNTIVNVYYDRNEYTFTFQSNRNENYTQYQNNDNYLYIASTPRITVHTVTRRYGASISDIWSFTGSNGQAFPYTGTWKTSWMPTGSSTYTARITRMETMPAEDLTFISMRSNKTTRHFHYYIEALPGAQNPREFNGVQYVPYVEDHVHDFQVVYYNDDVWQLDGFTFTAMATANGTVVPMQAGDNMSWTSNNTGTTTLNGTYGADSHLYFYYSRDKFPITYWDGVYVDAYGNEVEEATNQGLLHTGDENGDPIYYGAALDDHADDYVPTRDGYVLEGWYLDDACTQEFNFAGSTMPKGGIEIYAKWRQVQYRVFLHPNVTQTEDPNFSMGNQPTSFVMDYNEKIKPITAIRELYEPIGWYSDPEFNNAWNFGIYVLNDTNVTTAYDQTAPTDLTTPWATVNTANYNEDAAEGRFWISRQLDLYVKWRLKLIGAKGIQVYYDSVEGNGHFPEGTTPSATLMYDPVGYYTDEAIAVAQAAPTADKPNTEFKYWVVQTWVEGENGGEGSYQDLLDDAGKPVIVYPGGKFTVRRLYALEEEIPDAPEGAIYHLTYKMHLRAEYGTTEGPTPTHITWFSNIYDAGGNPLAEVQDQMIRRPPTGNYDTLAYDPDAGYGFDREGVQINNAIEIPPANTFSYPGYVFLGWGRVDNLPEGMTATDDMILDPADLSDENLFLKWVPVASEPNGGHYEAQLPKNKLTRDYYLCGYINGQDYGNKEDYERLGEFRISKLTGQLTVTFTDETWVGVKTGEANPADRTWFWVRSDGQEVTANSASLYSGDGNSKDFHIPHGVEVTITLEEKIDANGNVYGLLIKYSTGSAPSGNVAYNVVRAGESGEDQELEWREVQYVAADENRPYNDLYAVWGGEFYVYHSGMEGGQIETVQLTRATGTFNLAERIETVNATRDGTDKVLYGGYYLEGGFEPATYTEKTVGEKTIHIPAANCAAYDGSNWTWTTPQTANGMAIHPQAGVTYYIKEVPADKYLQPYFHYTYLKEPDPANQTLCTGWLISDLDDNTYLQSGVVLTSNDKVSIVCSSLRVENAVGGNTFTLNAKRVFGTTGLLNYWTALDNRAPLDGFGTGVLVEQYWVTPDNIRVTGITQRTYTGLTTRADVGATTTTVHTTMTDLNTPAATPGTDGE